MYLARMCAWISQYRCDESSLILRRDGSVPGAVERKRNDFLTRHVLRKMRI